MDEQQEQALAPWKLWLFTIACIAFLVAFIAVTVMVFRTTPVWVGLAFTGLGIWCLLLLVLVSGIIDDSRYKFESLARAVVVNAEATRETALQAAATRDKVAGINTWIESVIQTQHGSVPRNIH